jgi:hypothetical protein
MSFFLLSFLSPGRLLVVWLILFILLTDIHCPPFFTRCACVSCRDKGYGRGERQKSRE